MEGALFQRATSSFFAGARLFSWPLLASRGTVHCPGQNLRNESIDRCADMPDKSRMATDKPVRVLVLGAGFGGLTFCQNFRHPKAMVTLVDKTNHHLFQPLLYQVATAGLSAPDIAQPIRSILADVPRLQVVLDE